MKSYDVAVVGGGIAGLTAALNCARLGRSTVLLSGDLLGGHLLNIETIDGFPGYPDGIAGYLLCPQAQGQAADAGAEIAATEMTGLERDGGRWRIATREGGYLAAAVIVATGTSLRPLGVPGEDAFTGKGVSQCASCDGPLFTGEPVIVVGGGDSALQEALCLSQFASRVTILQRGDGLSGQHAYRERVDGDPKIEVRCGIEVQEMLGQGVLSGVRARDTADGGESIELAAAGVFVFVGLQANSALLGGLAALDAAGAILTDGAMRCGPEGLFAVGTVRAGAPGRAVAAAGDGAMAAIAAERYLSGGGWPAGA